MLAPYGYLGLEGPLDIARIRSGDTKYLVRRLFRRRYPGMREHDKIPLPRGVAAWLKDWAGPVRDEFARLMADKAHLEQVMKAGADEAAYYARKTMSKVRRKIGFVN